MSLETDEAGLLLRQVLMAKGGSVPILDSMNHFYHHRLGQILGAYQIITIKNQVYRFVNPVVTRPDIKDLQDQERPRSLWPAEARRRQLSYMAKLHATLQKQMVVDGKYVPSNEPGSEALVYLGKIPVMVGSELCRTYGLSDEDRYRKGEPLKDCRGYFIIKGTEKVFLNMEKLRTKMDFLYDEKEEFNVRYTSETLTETTLVMVKDDGYSVNVTFDKIGVKEDGANIFYIFHLMGFYQDTVEEALKVMDSFIVDTDPLREQRRRQELRYFLQSTVNTYYQKTNSNTNKIISDLLDMYKDTSITTAHNRDEKLVESIETEIFRNIVLPTHDRTNPYYKARMMEKIRLLAHMVVKYVEFKNGYRNTDDRDFWGNKRLDDAAKHISTRFLQIWKNIVGEIQKQVTAKNYLTTAQIAKAIPAQTMELQFVSSFTKELMGIGPHGKKDIVKVDILKRDTLLASFAHIRRINTPTNRRAKIREKRLLNNTQWGVACNINTPEGENCLEVSTPILMADGTQKPIGELKDGDEVMSFNVRHHKLEPTKIYKWFKLPVERSLKIEVRTGRMITCTLDHRFMTKDGWVMANDLVVGTEVLIHSLKSSYATYYPITHIEEAGPCEVADFTTESENHTMISGNFVTHNCGLVKDSALTIYVSLNRDENILRARLVGRYVLQPDKDHRYPLFLNGVCIGYCDPFELRKYLLTLRRSKQQIPFDTGIILNQYNELYVNTDDGRVCRPLLLVDPATQELLIDSRKMRGADLQTLLDNGIIEYIDVAEQEQVTILIAQSDRHLKKDVETNNQTIENSRAILADPKSTQAEKESAQKALEDTQKLQKYTHCEIDPTLIMGISASIIPLPEFTPAPRLTYQASMGKQALGPNSARVELRFDTTTRTILEPGVPAIATDTHEWLGLDKFPAGAPAIVAVTTYGGGNQEDAIIMNKGAIQRGYFMMMIYHSYTEKICNQKNKIREEIRVPDYSPDKASRYSKLDPTTGIVKMNEFVVEGDCLVGKVTIDTATGKVMNTSLFVDINKSGRVDGIYITETTDSCKLIRIRIREMRQPKVGDKFASRYSQKGTIGELVDEEDMPWIVSDKPELNGVRPHMLFNPHGIPSRMTMGKLMEMMVGMYASVTATRINTTAFRRFDYRTYRDLLVALGFSGSGKYKMMNGKTGRLMDVEIYLGPIYYQLLRHLVDDKMQARATGSVQFATRQPVPGIRREGGLRLGEMERDALIQHGAAYLLQERMSISSDAWQGIVCKDCGRLAVHKIELGTFSCSHCKTEKFVRINIPYAMKLYIQLLAALNIDVRLHTRD